MTTFLFPLRKKQILFSSPHLLNEYKVMHTPRSVAGSPFLFEKPRSHPFTSRHRIPNFWGHRTTTNAQTSSLPTSTRRLRVVSRRLLFPVAALHATSGAPTLTHPPVKHKPTRAVPQPSPQPVVREVARSPEAKLET